MEDTSTNVVVRIKRFLKGKNSFETISLFNSTLAIAISFYALYHSVWSWDSKLDVVVNGPILNTPKEKKLGLDITLVNTGSENIFINRLSGSCGFEPIKQSSDGERIQVFDSNTFELINEHSVSDWNPEKDNLVTTFPGDIYSDVLIKPGEIENFKLFIDADNKCFTQTHFDSIFYIDYEMLPAKGKALKNMILVGHLVKSSLANSNYFLQLNRALEYEWNLNTNFVSTSFSPTEPLDKYKLQFIHYTLDFHCNSWDFQYCNN